MSKNRIQSPDGMVVIDLALCVVATKWISDSEQEADSDPVVENELWAEAEEIALYS